MSSRNNPSPKAKDQSHNQQQSNKSTKDPTGRANLGGVSHVPAAGNHSGGGVSAKPNSTAPHGPSTSNPNKVAHSSPLKHPSPPNTNAKFSKDPHAVAALPPNHHLASHLNAVPPSETDFIEESTEHSNGPVLTVKQSWSNNDVPSSSTVDQSNLSSPSYSVPSSEFPSMHISELPENVLENLFTFLDLSDVRSASMVCPDWNRVISDENGDVWRSHCLRRMSREVLHSELLTACPSYKSKLRAYFHSWNPQDCSRNVYVKPNGFTIHRNPVAQSTDGARGKIGRLIFANTVLRIDGYMLCLI
jgi:hypothetical protein